MAAVIGVPDDTIGQAVMSVITLNEGARLSQKDVLHHCTKHLARFTIPKIVKFCETIPKTMAGKIDKLKLAAQYLGVAE